MFSISSVLIQSAILINVSFVSSLKLQTVGAIIKTFPANPDQLQQFTPFFDRTETS